MGASPTLWSGSSWPWFTLEASSWPCAHGPVQCVTFNYVLLLLPMAGDHTWGQHMLPPVNLFGNLQYYNTRWTLRGSWWRGAQEPSLQPSEIAWLGSTFGSAFHPPSFSWQLHYGAGALARRDPIPDIECSIPALVFPLLNSLRQSWPQSVQSATLFE